MANILRKQNQMIGGFADANKIDTDAGTFEDAEHNTYTGITTDMISYDATNNQLLLKVGGADSVIPFKKKSQSQSYSLQNSIAKNSVTLRYPVKGGNVFQCNATSGALGTSCTYTLTLSLYDDNNTQVYTDSSSQTTSGTPNLTKSVNVSQYNASYAQVTYSASLNIIQYANATISASLS